MDPATVRRAARSAVPLAAALLFVLAQSAGAQTDEVRVLASNGVKALMEELLPRCASAIGRPLAIRFDTSAALGQLIEAGEAFDVAIMTSEAVESAVKAGQIASGSYALVARSGIGVGIRAGTPKPDIRTADALRRALRNARAITYAGDGASRPHIARMLDRLGIAEEMTAKTLLEQGSVRSAGRVAAGNADLVITLISEILPIAGVELLGPLPAEFQNYVALGAGVATRSRNQEAARALVRFLAGPSVAATLIAKGMEQP
jgi:molybdate transport system substrate-binding protein